MFRMDLAATESIAPSTPTANDAPRVRSWQAAAIVAGALGLAAIGGTKDNVRSTVQQATIDWNLTAWVEAQQANLVRTWDSWTASASEFLSPSSEPANEPIAPTSQPANEPIAPTSQPANEPTTPTSQPANEPTAPTSQPHQRGKKSFALVVGAFADEANAVRLANDLKKSGYPAEVLNASVGLKKVALRTFASEDAARKAKAQLKGDFPAIWIYHE
jgi:cell division septation protein DedD